MRKLEELLSDISPSEREEALQYYNDYLNDAGKENEKEVIEALGSPEEVAEIVRAGLMDDPGKGEFTENGFASQQRTVRQNEIIKSEKTGDRGSTEQSEEQGTFREDQNRAAGNEGRAAGNEGSAAEGETADGKEKDGLPTWAVVLIVVACVTLSPAILGVGGGAFGVLIGLIAGIFGIVIGIAASMVALYAVAIGLVAIGIGTLFETPLIGVGLIGAGLLCAGLGVLFMILTVLIFREGIPALVKGCKALWKKITGKKEESRA